MEKQLTVALAVVGVGLLLVVLGAVSTGLLDIGAGSPSIVAPAGAPLILPAFMGAPFAMVLGIPAVLYWLVVWPVLRGRYAVPRLSVVVFAFLCLLSVAWFVAGWRYGVQYEGQRYTVVCLILNAVLAALALALAMRGRRRPKLVLRLSAQWLMVAWFITYGFAYLGETP